MDGSTRRQVLATGAAVTAVAVAGCGGNGDTNNSSSPGDGDGDPPPGADVLGGPGDLQSRADVDATVLDSDEGAGRYVFTPAIVWLEQGGTVVWHFEGTTHTVTVYHDSYDKPTRIPSGVETPFNSEFAGSGAPGTSFNFVFDTPGVWNYFCQPHEGQGMVGLVIVDSPQGGPGTSAPTDVSSATARENLGRLLDAAGIDG